jgi:CheY-like chemotaxis protein
MLAPALRYYERPISLELIDHVFQHHRLTDEFVRNLNPEREASDGLEAVQKAEELGPDLILLDIGLPKFRSASASSQSWTAWPSAIPRWT